LRAANQAIGTNAGDLTDHPNLIPFKVQPGEFPNLDDVMSWILHVTYRQRQLQVLDSELRLVAHQLLNHPAPPEDIESIKKSFVKVFKKECRNARSWISDAESRRKFRQIISWTSWFHPAFLRELACADFIQRNEGPGLVLSQLRHDKWYCPILDHPDWTAWGVVLEVALRRTLAAWRGEAESWAEIREEIRPGFGLHPTIVFFQDLENPFPQALTFYVEAYEPPWYRPEVLGAFQRQRSWRLNFRDLPWPCQPRPASQLDDCPVPSAREIWKLAIGKIPEGPHLSFGDYFGENHEYQSQTA